MPVYEDKGKTGLWFMLKTSPVVRQSFVRNTLFGLEVRFTQLADDVLSRPPFADVQESNRRLTEVERRVWEGGHCGLRGAPGYVGEEANVSPALVVELWA
jgi:hypothetical protein